MRKFKDDLTDIWFILGIIFGVMLLGVTVTMYLFGEELAFGGRTCAFQVVTHLYCPGCGGTRAVYYLTRGRIVESFLHNPFVVYTVSAYLIFMINTILVRKTRKLGFEGYPVSITVYVGIGVLLLQWIIRNILLVAFGITCL